MHKVAYSIADISKGIHGVRKAGKIFHRHVGVENPTAHLDKARMFATKGTGIGPAALTQSYSHNSQLTKEHLSPHNLKPGVYVKGDVGKILTDLNENMRKAKNPTGLADTILHHLGKSKQNHGITYKSMPKGDKHMVNAIALRHEMDEIKAAKSIKQQLKHQGHTAGFNASLIGTSHIAPSVLYRESNNVARAGKGTGEVYHKARGLYMDFRKNSGESKFLKDHIDSLRAAPAKNTVFPGKKSTHNDSHFEYGKTRLSRHAIKHLDRLAMEKGHVAVHV